MKKITLLSLLLVFFWACEEENLPLLSPDTRFIHDIAGCDNGGNFEINCREFLILREDNRADYLIGGGDIVEIGSYSRLGNRIILQTNSSFLGNIDFEVRNDGTLLRLDNETIWLKEE